MTPSNRVLSGELSDAEYREASQYSHRFPAFKGTYEFDLTIQMLGNRVTRKAKAEYMFTPEWEYYDLNKLAPHVGLESASYHVEVEAVPQEYHDDGTVTEGTRQWVKMKDLIEDGVLPHEVWDVLLNEIDQQCKVEDTKRRQAAKKKPRR